MADAVKLSREDVAGVYHVNPALIWPGSGQTYASARDNARALYNDTLAPLLMQATDRINMALLPMVGEPRGHYVVYDISIKTQGTMEELISAGQTACGAPFLTRNEMRALLNRPAIEGADELIVPLNVLEGGLASSHDTDPTVERYNSAPVREKAVEAEAAAPRETAPASRKARGDPREGDAEELEGVYRRFFERQAKSVIPKIESGAGEWWNAERWNRELADDLYAVALKQSAERGGATAVQVWGGSGSYDRKRTEAYVRKMCERRAEMVNEATRASLASAIEGDGEDAKSARAGAKGLTDTVRGVFEFASQNRALTAGAALATAVAGWAVLEACRQNSRSGERTTKTWVATSGNPRASHAAMDGETVPYDSAFSNGAQWPGDVDALDASEVANCRCQLEIEVRESGGYDRATVRGVAKELGLGTDYDPAAVYAAYEACSATIGQSGEWSALTGVERAAVTAELRERDIEWVKRGKVPKPTYQSERALNELRPHEELTRDTITRNGLAQHIIERSNEPNAKSADCLVGSSKRKADWKSPKGVGFNSIDQLMRDVGKKAEIAIVDLQEGRSVMSLADAIRHYRRCGVRRGVKEAIFIDYDRTVHRIKL